MKTPFSLAAALLVAGLVSHGPAAAAEPGPVRIRVTGESRAAAEVDFLIGDELAARYVVGPQVAKPYLWPVYAPGGVPVTRAWPMRKGEPGETTDHVHQKSVWFCHGDVVPEGLTLTARTKGVEGVDFWAEHAGSGRIVCTAVEEPRAEGESGSIRTRNEWRTADGTTILDEARTISLHLLGGARLFVFDIDLKAGAYPIVFADTKEGCFGARVHDRMREQGGAGKLVNAEGQTGEKNIWGRPSVWLDYSGPVDGRVVGLAIFDDPGNKSPACWHSRGYGLTAANPFGRAESGFPAMRGKTDLVRLEKGESLKLRYGLLVHTGDAVEGKVAEHYQQFLRLKAGTATK